MAETLRRHFAHLGYVSTLLVLIVIVMSMTAIAAPAPTPYEIIGLFTLVVGCQLIGPEFSKGTLQLILSKPVGRSTYLVSRVVGVVLAIWFAILVMFASEVIGRLIVGTPITWRAALAAVLVTALKALLVCCLLAFFGSFSRSYVNAGIYIGGQILLSMVFGLLSVMKNAVSGEMGKIGAMLCEHPAVLESFGAIRGNLVPDNPAIPFDRNWTL